MPRSQRISFSVPPTATISFDSVYARFRYGYEHGIGPTARAIAGEVEDYAINVVPSGPLARNDLFDDIRENSLAQTLDVLRNDNVRSDSAVRITNITSPSNGGRSTQSVWYL